MKNYAVYMKFNELGKIADNPIYFSNLDEAKEYCQKCFSSLGDSKFYDESIDGIFKLSFTREFSVADQLGYIAKEKMK